MMMTMMMNNSPNDFHENDQDNTTTTAPSTSARMFFPLDDDLKPTPTSENEGDSNCNAYWSGGGGSAEGIFPLLKCTSAIRQLAYDIVPDFLDECLQMSTKTSRLSLDHFCTFVPEIFDQYLRKPTMTDVVKLYQHHEENHGFLGMLGSLDCTDWECFGCPYAHKGQYVRRDHGPNPFILRAPEIPFVANGLAYPWGYYLIDEICLELAPLVKAIPEPSHDDCKRI
ncbi:ALP1-like protein isoform X1, partial [Tanacetum coccineum]